MPELQRAQRLLLPAFTRKITRLGQTLVNLDDAIARTKSALALSSPSRALASTAPSRYPRADITGKLTAARLSQEDDECAYFERLTRAYDTLGFHVRKRHQWLSAVDRVEPELQAKHQALSPRSLKARAPPVRAPADRQSPRRTAKKRSKYSKAGRETRIGKPDPDPDSGAWLKSPTQQPKRKSKLGLIDQDYDPPGYWDMGFPTTQEVEELNKQAPGRRLLQQDREAKLRAAEREARDRQPRHR